MSKSDESDESEDMDSNILYLKHKRKYMRSEITKINNKIENEIDTFAVEEKSRLALRIEKLRPEVEIINQKVFKCLFSAESEEAEIQEEYDACIEYDNTLAACREKLRAVLPVRNSDSASNTNNYSRGALKLPKVPLPEFSNKDGEDLHKFILNFESIINKYKLSPYEKFIYLQNQLSNEPLTIIKSLEVGRQTYEDAKDLLQKAFANITAQQYRTLKQLSELKLNRNEDPYTFISKMRTITESFETLEISSEIVLQYFFWTGMNDELQQQFINITNSCKPNLAQIKKYTFDAAERYLTLPRKTKMVSDSTLVSAATVNYSKENGTRPKRKYCGLCSGKGTAVETHNTFECRKYPTAEEKCTRLKSLNGCVKCGRMSHSTKECAFKFKQKCEFCNYFHFSYLCNQVTKNKDKKKITKKDDKPQQPKKDTEKDSLQSGSVFIGKADIQQYGEDSIIPTFSVKYFNKYTLRCMRDSGCQPNLITSKCAKILKLKPISNEFPLNINGFNKSEKHQVKVVELKLNPDMQPIKTICVPEIKVKLKLPGLSDLAKSFEKKRI